MATDTKAPLPGVALCYARHSAPPRSRARCHWHFGLHAFDASAFFTQAPYAPASFFGFAAVGAVADERQVAPPEVQLWIESTYDWQSLSLPQAAAGFAHALSTHEPQSVLPKVGEGGGAASAGAAEAVAAGSGFSAGAADAASAGFSASALDAGASEPEPEFELSLLSSAALSAGF